MEQNYSFFAIPTLYLIASASQAWKIAYIKKHNNGRYYNVHPRGSKFDNELQKTLPAAVYGKAVRADSAHYNTLENLSLFSAAILAGNVAKLSPYLLNRFAALYLLSRIAYTFMYINIDSNSASYVRSVTFATGTFGAIWVLIKSGMVMM